MHKKKWFERYFCFALVLAAVLAAAVLAWQLIECQNTAPEVVTEIEIVEERPGTFYFLAANNADPFYVPGVAGFTDAGKEVGMKTMFVGPMDLNSAAQMKTFEELVASPETKGIFWYPMDFNLGEVFIRQCKEKGIPIVIGAADSPFKTRDAFIGVSDEVFGTQAGSWAADLIECKGKVGTMALVQPNTDARIAAFTDYIKQACPDVEHAERVTHDGSVASATTVLDAYMVANPDMTLIYFADGSGGQQFQNWKEKQAGGLETMFLATDSPPLTLQAIKDGIFVGTVAQNTYVEEYWGVMLLDALSRGIKVPDTIYLGVERIDRDNVDQFLTP